MARNYEVSMHSVMGGGFVSILAPKSMFANIKSKRVNHFIKTFPRICERDLEKNLSVRQRIENRPRPKKQHQVLHSHNDHLAAVTAQQIFFTLFQTFHTDFWIERNRLSSEIFAQFCSRLLHYPTKRRLKCKSVKQTKRLICLRTRNRSVEELLYETAHLLGLATISEGPHSAKYPRHSFLA